MDCNKCHEEGTAENICPVCGESFCDDCEHSHGCDPEDCW